MAEQEALTAKEHSHKAAEAFDHSLSVLNGYWNGLRYDGYAVYSTAVPSLHLPRPQPKRTAELIDQFVNSSPTAIREKCKLAQVCRFLTFLCRHMNRTTYHLSFLKCEARGCEHCSSHPVHSTEVVAYLRKHGGRMFSPTESTQNPGHFFTLTECEIQHLIGKPTSKPDALLPSGIIGRCTFRCSYVCTSKRGQSSIMKKFDDDVVERSMRSGNIQPPVMLPQKNAHHIAARIMDAASALHRCTNFKSTTHQSSHHPESMCGLALVFKRI